MIRRGHVHLVRMPGERKQRPVVVLSPDRRNELASDVVVVPCSTASRVGPWHVRLARHEGGLDRASHAKCEQPATLPKEWLAPAPLGGPLPASRMREIRDALLRALAFDD